ncbi:OmpA family protein [Marilutibacter spongiae]|uniref:OmpA family protein n=1 Tax=Marilutibacter spongiae TaxID=2025720 RepID=A0A7W3TNZ0_9GAMM|nr:OmpA family protein [Lysobacter spongiae]MBB1061841.1 OmpA family protein [Lysobacter spongiae]
MQRYTRSVLVLLPLAMLLAAPPPADAGEWLRKLKRVAGDAVQQEVEDKVDEQSRRVARCAMGDEACVSRAQARGDIVQMEVQGDSPAPLPGAGPSTDIPLVSPYPGSVRTDRDVQAHADYVRITGFANRRPTTEPLEGRLTYVRYRNPAGRSTLEILRHYREALVAQGFRLDWECASRKACGSTGFHDGRSYSWKDINGLNPGIAGDTRYFTGRTSHENGFAYVSISINPQVTDLQVLETPAVQAKGGGVTADSLASGLAKDGKVTLDGIHFDTGRATLRSESGPALDAAARLMREQPALRLAVVGHTDSSGDPAANLQLSRQRAGTVLAALVSRGVPAARLSASGRGSGMPVASNATEAGRALNRRVELVKP